MYIAYQSKDSQQSQSKKKRGILETLLMCKGFEFDPNDRIRAILSTNISNGSIFTFSETDKENIERINLRGKKSGQKKQLRWLFTLLR